MVGFTNINGLAKGASLVTWEQPILTSNGEWGVDELATRAKAEYANVNGVYAAFHLFNGKNIATSDGWSAGYPTTTMPTWWECSFNPGVFLQNVKFYNRNAGAGQALTGTLSVIKAGNTQYTVVGTWTSLTNTYGAKFIDFNFSSEIAKTKVEVLRLDIESQRNAYTAIGAALITAQTLATNYTPYTVQALNLMGVEPASTLAERQQQLNELGVY